MSLRKTQLKKMTLQEIMTRLSAQVNSDNIKLINTFISEKNSTLLDKRSALLQQIESTRRKIQKNVHSLNHNIKDRVQRREKIVMDKDSRPSTQDMTSLMELYAYMQDQGHTMDRNTDYVRQLSQNGKSAHQNLSQKALERQNSDGLDREYNELHQKCQEQQLLKSQLLNERNDKRNQYANIIKTIQQCRVEYDDVESKIRDNERQLIRIATYYNSRVSQDNAALVQLPQKAIQYQQQLLSAQEKLNKCSLSYQDRLIRQIEVEATIYK